MAIRLMIIDDHDLIRAGLMQYFKTQPGVEVVAEAANGEALLQKLLTVSADLLLLDIWHIDALNMGKVIPKNTPPQQPGEWLAKLPDA